MVALRCGLHQENHDDTAKLVLPPIFARETPSKEIEGSSPTAKLGAILAIGGTTDGDFASKMKLGARGI